MRNDNHRWTPPTPLSRVGDGVMVTQVDVGGQAYVSGVDARDRFAGQLIAWPDEVHGDSYALSLRRDRVLLAGPIDLTPGFAKGLALTDMSDAFDVVDLTGPMAIDRLKTGAEIRFDQPSQSVVRRLFGVEVMLCRLRGEGFRLHIPRALGQAIVELLA